MKFTWNWLTQHLSVRSTPAATADFLTRKGFETYTQSSWLYGPYVQVARIVSVDPHPQATHLKICWVDTGETVLHHIICGAANAQPDLWTVVALPGAVLPHMAHPLGVVVLRGLTSSGMLTSADELNMKAFSAPGPGLVAWDPAWLLDSGFQAGTLLDTLLGEPDVVLDVEITPNRGDMFSVRGMARALAGWGHGTLQPLNDAFVQRGVSGHALQVIRESFPWTVHIDPSAVPVVWAVHLRHLRLNQAAWTPLVIQRFFEHVKKPTVGCPVDIANFITLDLGQPLHVWDRSAGTHLQLTCDATGILTDFKHQHHAVVSGDLVACLTSPHTPEAHSSISTPMEGSSHTSASLAALPGLMGAPSCSWTPGASDVVLEAGWFSGATVGHTGQRLSLLSESRTRMERGLDPQMLEPAAYYASQWMAEAAGETWNLTRPQPHAVPLNLPLHYVQHLTGYDVSLPHASAVLTELGYAVSLGDKQLTAIPPSWRHDIEAAEDLVEDVMQHVGYECIPLSLLPTALPSSVRQEGDDTRRLWIRLAAVLTGYGYHEVITYPWRSQIEEGGISLCNPLGEDQKHLRTSLIPSLLTTVHKNLVRQDHVAGVYERGSVFGERQGIPYDEQHLSCVVCASSALHWDTSAVSPNLQSLKAGLWHLLLQAGVDPQQLIPQETVASALYHPFRCQTLHVADGDIVMTWGDIHPHVVAQNGLKGRWMACEIVLPALWRARRLCSLGLLSLSDQPCVTRDLAFWITAPLLVGHVASVVRGAATVWCTQSILYDIFPDPLSHKTSAAFRLTWQHPTRSLTEEDIHTLMQQCIDAAAQAGAVLRDGRS